MTILDKFIAFAEGLSSDRRIEIEGILESLMASEDASFTAEELAELDRRAVDESEQWIDEETFRAKLRALRA